MSNENIVYFHINNTILKDIFPIDVGHQVFLYNEKPFDNHYPYYLLHYVIKGSGDIVIDDKKTTFTKNSIFILPPNKKITYIPRNNSNWEYYWINFNGTGVKNILTTINISEEKYYFDYKVSNLEKIFKKCFIESEDDIERMYIATSVLMEVFSVLKKMVPTEVKVSDKNSFDIILNYITENIYEKDLTAEKVANHFNFSRGYFSNTFKKNLNTTFKEYVNYERIKKATTLMVNTTYPIKGIADMVGFNDPLYFSKIFKKYRLVSPVEYRESFGKIED